MLKKYLSLNGLKFSALIVSGDVMLSQVMRLFSNLILTRLLVPEMFGVMVIAMIFIVGITMLSDLGLREKFVQSENSHQQAFIDSCWSIQVVRGFVITLVLVIVSFGLLAVNLIGLIPENSTYASKELPWLIFALSITALVQGFNSPSIYQLYRGIRVYEIAKINILSQLLGAVSMLVVAYFYRDIWVLLISPIISSFYKLYLSYQVKGSVRASFKFDRRYCKEIITFGKWIFIGSLLSYILMSSDRIILGALLTPEMLGIYSIAFLFSNSGNELFTKIISSVVYPKLSSTARKSPELLFKVMYDFRMRIDAVTFLISGFLFGSGSIVIYALYDSRYYEAGWMFEILSISILFIGLNVSHFSLMALGKSYSYAIVNLISVIFILIALPFVYYNMGFEWAIVVIALRKLVTVPFIFILQKRNDLFSLIKEVRMFPVFFVSYSFGYGIKLIVVMCFPDTFNAEFLG